MPDIEEQVEAVLKGYEVTHGGALLHNKRKPIFYIRHHGTFDQVWFGCDECWQGEHEEVVKHVEGTFGEPTLECPWADVDA